MFCYYTNETILTYGKYKMYRLKDVPPEYLINLWENNKGGFDEHMRDYLKVNIERIKSKQLKDKEPIDSNPEIVLPVTFKCNKRTYATKKAALDSIIGKGEKKGKSRPVRAYECHKCSGWHLTSKSPTEYMKTVERYKK